MGLILNYGTQEGLFQFKLNTIQTESSTLFNNSHERTCSSSQCSPAKNKYILGSTVKILASGKELQTMKKH